MSNTLPPVSKQDIKDGLTRLGVGPGSVIGVHSSLRSFGQVEGGPDTVVDAVMETVGETGAIVMPAYLVSLPVELTPEDVRRGLTWKVKILPYDPPPARSGMGRIADRFRDRPGVVRSHDGIFTLAAWGRDAGRLARGYQHLLAWAGDILLLGVDMTRCSALHLAEARVPLPPELTAQMQGPQDLQRYYPPSEWSVGCAVPFVNFLHVQEEAEARGLIRTTTIGNATVRHFPAAPVVTLYEELRRENPTRLIDHPA